VFQRRRQGAVDVVYGDDPLNADFAPTMLQVLRNCGTQRQPHVVVDFEHIPLIDSAGLEAILDVHEEFQQRGGTMKLAVSHSLCREILDVTGVGGRFEIFPDVASAVGSFVQ
jgi:anti-anti-sigma factor